MVILYCDQVNYRTCSTLYLGRSFRCHIPPPQIPYSYCVLIWKRSQKLCFPRKGTLDLRSDLQAFNSQKKKLLGKLMLLPTFLPLCISLDKVWKHTAYKTHSSTSQKIRWMGRPFSNCKKVTLWSKCLDLAQGKSFCRDSNNAFITPCLCHVYCRTPCMMDSLLYNALHNNSCYLLGNFHHFKYLKSFYTVYLWWWLSALWRGRKWRQHNLG